MTTPAIAASIDSDGKQIVVVGLESGAVCARRYGYDGRANGHDAIVVAKSPKQRDPQIAFDGKRHLIVWLDDGEVVGRFLKMDGSVDDDTIRFTANTGANSVAVAWLGSEYLVVWSGKHPSASTVSATGTLNVLPLFGRTMVATNIAIAAGTGPGDAVIAFGFSEHGGPGANAIGLIHLRRHDITERSETRASPREVALASAHWGYVVAWQQTAEDQKKYVYLQRLNYAGQPVGRPQKGPKVEGVRTVLTILDDGDNPLVLCGDARAPKALLVTESRLIDAVIALHDPCRYDMQPLLAGASLAYTCDSDERTVRISALPVPNVQ